MNFTLPFSCRSDTMTMIGHFCSQIMHQKSGMVQFMGPCVAMYSLTELQPWKQKSEFFPLRHMSIIKSQVIQRKVWYFNQVILCLVVYNYFLMVSHFIPDERAVQFVIDFESGVVKLRKVLNTPQFIKKFFLLDTEQCAFFFFFDTVVSILLGREQCPFYWTWSSVPFIGHEVMSFFQSSVPSIGLRVVQRLQCLALTSPACGHILITSLILFP